MKRFKGLSRHVKCGFTKELNTFFSVCNRLYSFFTPVRGWGRATQQNFRLEGTIQIFTPLAILYTIFDGEGTPLVCLLLTNGTPFTYLV